MKSFICIACIFAISILTPLRAGNPYDSSPTQALMLAPVAASIPTVNEFGETVMQTVVVLVPVLPIRGGEAPDEDDDPDLQPLTLGSFSFPRNDLYASEHSDPAGGVNGMVLAAFSPGGDAPDEDDDPDLNTQPLYTLPMLVNLSNHQDAYNDHGYDTAQVKPLMLTLPTTNPLGYQDSGTMVMAMPLIATSTPTNY